MTKGIVAATLNNDILISTLLGWTIAQGIKIGIGVIREKRFDFRWLLGTGGMPSAHAAGVASLATAIGVEFGFDSGLFALGVTFAIVTMFDAQGVRRAAGKQASILNKLISEHPANIKVQEKRLIELLGHTPIEVISGAFVGIFVALSYL